MVEIILAQRRCLSIADIGRANSQFARPARSFGYHPRMWTIATSFADAEPAVYWTSQPRPVPIQPQLDSSATADLAIIGGGFTGLWAAIEAKQRDSSRDVVLLEMEEIAFGATGRNGGFLDPSLTHGLETGIV